MPDPATHEEYLALAHKNVRYSGFGFETTIHMPCPFCSAPDFIVCKVVDTQAEIVKDRKCGECERSAKGIIANKPNEISIELVQTGGPDQPAYLGNVIRRMS